MTEYGISNIHTNEENIIFGYSFADACRRAKLNVDNWEIIYSEYID